MKTLKFSALATAAAAVVFGLLCHFLPGGAQPDAEPHLSSVFPGASSFEKVEGGRYPYYKAAGPAGTEGALFVTSGLAPSVRGYSGPVPVLVGLAPDGRLTGVKILQNNETPSYLRKVERSGFETRFKGKFVTDPFKLDGDIDGVTRATVTAAAVAEGVKRASRRAASDLFGFRFPREESPLLRALKDPAVYAVVAVFASSLFLYLKGGQGGSYSKYRWAVLAASFLLLGLYEASPLALGNLFNLIALRLPGVENLSWHMLVFGALIAALLWGRLYCGWACPFGALQEFLSRLPVRKLDIVPETDRKARGLKYGILWLVTVAVFTTGLLEVGNFEPYGTLFSGQGGVFAWGLVGATLGAGIIVPRFWCRYLCPVGAALGLMSGFSLLNTRRFAGCDNCGACSGSCGMGNRAGGEDGWSGRECIGCNLCISACPKRREAAPRGVG